MKQVILEKVYGNIGKGFKEFFASELLSNLPLNARILPLASYKGKDKRFIYKRIGNYSIFLSSISSGRDDKSRGGNFLSHFIILESIKELNPTEYINSKSFISDTKEVLEKKKEITLFQKTFNKIEKKDDRGQNNVVLDITKNIVYSLLNRKKVIFYVDNIKQADKLLYSIFSYLPKNITVNLSFSINADKLNKQTICDINILDRNESNIYNEIKGSIVNITDIKNDVFSDYTDFLSRISYEEVQNFLLFLEQRNFSLETLESASKSYLIHIGKYPIKTEQDILDNIIGIFNKEKLESFLLKYIDKNINISNNTIRRIDEIVNQKYGELASSTYYKFIVKYSQNDYRYFLEKYNHNEAIFLYLSCSYNLGEKAFINKLEDLDILNFLIKNNFYKEVFYIQKYKLHLLGKSWSFASAKLEMEKEIFTEYFDSLSESEKINSFFFELWEDSSKKLELTTFIYQKFQNFLDKDIQSKLLTSINQIISSKDVKSIEVSTFLEKNNFMEVQGLERIKLLQVKYFLNHLKITENNLDKIIKIIHS